MSTTDPDVDPPAGDVHVRAGEYVLGVLDVADAASVRREAMLSLDLADAIVRWEVRLAGLGAVAPVAPPTDLWTRIAAAIEARPAAAGDGMAATRLAPPGPARVGRGWRTATFAALALAAAIAAVAFVPPRSTQLVQVAALAPAGAATAFLAQARPDGTVVVTSMSPAAVPTSRDLQLWLLVPGAAQPVSLGVLPASGRTLALPGPLVAGTQLLVSLEPLGGSPTGLPTGPVLYGGAFRPG